MSVAFYHRCVVLLCFFLHTYACKYVERMIVHSTHHRSHQCATHSVELAIVGKAARKPPPPPELFLVHFDCCRSLTAGDDDAPADCCSHTHT